MKIRIKPSKREEIIVKNKKEVIKDLVYGIDYDMNPMR